MAIFNVSSRDIAQLLNYSRKYHVSLFEAAERSENGEVKKNNTDYTQTAWAYKPSICRANFI